MLFERSDGLRIAVDVTDYQFPMGSCNWLHIKSIIRMPDGRAFESRDPSIETTDLPALLEWLQAAQAGQVPELSFIEPNLSLETLEIGSVHTVRVVLSAESKPLWVSGARAEFDFPAASLPWISLREDVTKWISQFPNRQDL